MVAVRIAWVLFTCTFALIGGVFGYAVSVAYLSWAPVKDLLGGATRLQHMSIVAIVLLGALLGFIIASFAYRRVVAVASDLQKLSFADKMAGVIGILLGLAVSFLITYQFMPLKAKSTYFTATIPFLAAIICVYLGVALTMSMKEELASVLVPRTPADAAADPPEPESPKIKFLDTNVIIDGRMADLCKTGFLEGHIYVPAFVLDELQQIADSEDSLRRARGRRGLDVLSRMQKESSVRVDVFHDYDREIERIPQVDSKLVRLAREKDGAIVTNDFNLNKVAELQRVPVLNINELANALKPVVLPGEELSVTIVKQGKENRQGVAYLDDGTMVVVEEAANRIGETLTTAVTSVLQTVAGKMIFAELASAPASTRNHTTQASSGDDLFGDDDSDRSGSRYRQKGGRGRGR